MIDLEFHRDANVLAILAFKELSPGKNSINFGLTVPKSQCETKKQAEQPKKYG